jgi:hypothetical protein
MADSKTQRDAEVWIREQWLPKVFGQQFFKKKLPLRSGGKFEFDGVSLDDHIAVSISTSCGITNGGKKASPKLHKMRADALFLFLANVEQRFLVFSDRCMFDLCQAEINSGRFPHEVKIRLVESLPVELETALVNARRLAALEVSPSGIVRD